MWGIPIQINWEWFLVRKAILQILHKMEKLQTIQPHHKETLSKPPRKVFKNGNDAIANSFKTVQTSLMQSCITACLPLPSCYRYSLLSVSLCYSILILLLIMLHCSFSQERLLGFYLDCSSSQCQGGRGVNHVYKDICSWFSSILRPLSAMNITTKSSKFTHKTRQIQPGVNQNPLYDCEKPNRGTDGGTS